MKISATVASLALLLAAARATPYCTNPDYDPDGDGWGWENSASCIVVCSAADTACATTAPPAGSGKCVFDTLIYPVCKTDTGSWGYESSAICMSSSFCPASRASAQTAISSSLVDSSATTAAKAVFSYLKSIWGSKTIAGVMDLTWLDSTDMFNRVVLDTGKAPALMGYDFLNYPYTYTVDGQKQVEEAIAHWQKGGIVAFNWHWRVGSNLEFYTSSLPSFYIPIKNNQLDTTSADWTTIVSGLDIVAKQLKRLQDAGVPVLWRPLHEASGGWFWWGRPRTDGVPAAYAYTLLYRYMYNYFTTTYGLHNLIWVWNGQKSTWYPGDKYVDIVGTDIYDGTQNYVSEVASYKALASWPTQVKPVALTENSNIPDPDNMSKDGAWWLWFMVWNDGTAGANVTDANNFWSGEYYNTNAHKKAVFNHANVITLDELPSFGATTTATPTTTPTPTTTKTATTTPTTTKTATTAPATTAPTGTVAHYGQCGGSGYTGATTCVSPYTCVYSSAWYSQCL